MLKAVSSITNAIGALNYKGTWNANTNSPALASGVGTKGDYYVVGTAGTTTLDGISNWGIGDWAVFNGSAWQRVEGGADLNGVNLSVSGTATFSALTASKPVFTDANKNLTSTGTVSVANGGTGLSTIGNGYLMFGDGTNAVATTNDLVWNNASKYLGIGTGGSPGKNLDIATTTATTARLRTTTAASGTGTLLFEIANNFSGISQSYVQGIGSGGSGVSQLAFGVSITAGAVTATDVARFDTSGNFRPSADNTYSNGTGALRWSVIYAATGTINTSDASTKTVIGSIDDAEKRVAQRIKSGIKKFKFNDAIAAKGDAARIHWGVVAQDVRAAFEAEGLNAEHYGLFCSDTWFEKDGQKVLDENGEIMTSGTAPDGAVKVTRLGVRYEELLAFIIASI